MDSVVCERCALPESEFDLDSHFYEIYKVAVCSSCKKKYPDDYRLIPKTTAKKDFLLTDEELADAKILPHYEKPNPKSPKWKNMQLYLRKHVVAFAKAKWGSLEELESAKGRQSIERTQRKVRKFEDKVAELRKRTRIENWQKKQDQRKESRTHVHTFSAQDSKQVCTVCGFSVDFEVI